MSGKVALIIFALISRPGDNPIYVVPSQVIAVMREANGKACDTAVLTSSGTLWTCLTPEQVKDKLEHPE